VAKQKKISYRQLIDAVEMDGLPKVTGTLFRSKPRGKDVHSLISSYREPQELIGAACAIGQACINLGIRQPDGALVGYIMGLNDNSKADLQTIANKARTHFAKSLDKLISVTEYDWMPWVKKDVYAPKVKETADASVG